MEGQGQNLKEAKQEEEEDDDDDDATTYLVGARELIRRR